MKARMALLVMLLPATVYALDLTAGKSEADAPALFIELYKQRLSPVTVVEDWQNEKNYFYLSRAGSLHYFDAEAGERIRGWPLTRWEHQHVVPEIRRQYAEFFVAYPDERYPSAQHHGVGCTGLLPLRYGDLEGGGELSLVLILAHHFVVFSPAHEAIVFAEELKIDDWLSEEEAEQLREWGQREEDAQYLSRIASEFDVILPGYRGYSKLFFGDFAGSGAAEIVIWRKLYQSREKDDPVAGFELERNEWQHYRRRASDGQYIPQGTPEELIRAWLSERELTWADGYPRYSECPGEAGELIPEMHDPLLNDLEVLPNFAYE
ncbi:hypothetical protein CAI21_15050 [Alkalilimnicola ehrlichii]|uniref:YARHG domain-containing protein n=2 Tax=Alkalilimnicola ehrlichii TaxID=351052 RepID=A0A3E0WQU7_9GAMM|nr:hypothetical protein CAI21_15050 [Alkalilimnicola ehrlichii]RFA35340.1 hypothetical protein CAL65_12710 [Alkalilimnicola ehrlichii]